MYSSSQSNNQVKIPKIIMQTWKTAEVPERWKDSPLSIQQQMPDWKYVLMTDEMNRKFVYDHFPHFLKTYDNFPYPIQRADAIRYMWLYVNGGVYLDLDIVITRRLDSFFTSDAPFYLVHSGNVGSYYTNALMASQAGCSFWLECLEEMKKPPQPYWIGRHFLVMNTTGPMMLTRVAGRTTYVFGHLPVKPLIPCSLCDLPCQRPSDAYAYAIPGSSWVTWDTVVYTFFFCHWKGVLMLLSVLVILVIVFLFAWWLRPRW